MPEPETISMLTMPDESVRHGALAVESPMTEAEFQAFYDTTARSLKSYLYRLVSSSTLADDLAQESYFRFLRASTRGLDPGGRKNYLFRIATNLARDHYRGKRFQTAPLDADYAEGGTIENEGLAADVQKVLDGIAPRERELMWLAYVEGASHREIAGMTGVKEASIRPMLFRIRQKVATALRAAGFGPQPSSERTK